MSKTKPMPPKGRPLFFVYSIETSKSDHKAVFINCNIKEVHKKKEKNIVK